MKRASLPKTVIRRTFGYVSRTRIPDSQDEGINPKFNVRVDAVGKPNRKDHPYLIANELICLTLAQAVRLPVPAFSVMQNKKESRMISLIRFDANAPALSAAPIHLWKTHPFLATGITIFDIFVGNPDRHTFNLKVDNLKAPTRVHLFDFDRALFYYLAKGGEQRLKDKKDDSCIEATHCLAKVIEDAAGFNEWISRIQDLQPWFIESICEEARQYGITQTESNAAQTFLLHRKFELGALVTKALPLFASLKDPPLLS
jgi:hypothetical protein